MKWRRAYTDNGRIMSVYYVSENGKYSITAKYVKVSSRKTDSVGYKQTWVLKNENNDILFEGTTLKSCKAYAENL